MNPLRIFISSVQSEFARERTAVLLFGKSPQRFLISSEVRCAHFHGTEVAKPIPSYQVYKGDAVELVDQALDFVLSKINRSVGTRAEGVRAPRTYEIPAEVVTEAIVNAVAHRDYTDNGSVQVMLFADRLEVRNPGRLPPPLTLEKLREAHRSVPGNPLLAESMYLAEYIERMGTGTLDMIRRCVEAGLPEPEFAVSDGFVTTVWRPVGPERVAVGAEERVTGVASDHVDSHSGPSGKREQAGVQGGWQEGQRESRAGVMGGKQGCKPECMLGCKLNWKPETPTCCELASKTTWRAGSCRMPEAMLAEHAASSSGSTASWAKGCWK